MNKYRAERTTPEEQKKSRRVGTIQNRSSFDKFPLNNKNVQSTLCHRKSLEDPKNHEAEDENHVKDKKKPQKSDQFSTFRQVTSRLARLGSASSSSEEESKCIANKDVDDLLRRWGFIVGDHIKIKENANIREGDVCDESLLKEKSQEREIKNKIAWESWYAKKKEATKRGEEFDRKNAQEKHEHDGKKKTKHHERQQNSYERWLFGKLETDTETNSEAEKSQNTEEEKKIVIENRKEQRREKIRQALHTWIVEGRSPKEEVRRLWEANKKEHKEHKEQRQRAFEEWKLKSANKPKPMTGKIYDPQANFRITSNMFINPKPWTRDF